MSESLLKEEDLPITKEWLKSVGFKWHQLDRQPDKHWLLWLGSALNDRITGFEDLGIEVAPNRGKQWFCWLRADTSSRYHRFIHIRGLDSVGQLIKLIEGLTGQAWNPANNLYGSMHTPEHAQKIREDAERLDHRIRETNPKWAEIEKDDTRGRALPEHYEAHEKRK